MLLSLKFQSIRYIYIYMGLILLLSTSPKSILMDGNVLVWMNLCMNVVYM